MHGVRPFTTSTGAQSKARRRCIFLEVCCVSATEADTRSLREVKIEVPPVPLRPRPCMSVAPEPAERVPCVPARVPLYFVGVPCVPYSREKKEFYFSFEICRTHGTPIKYNGTRPGTHGTQTLWDQGTDTACWGCMPAERSHDKLKDGTP